MKFELNYEEKMQLKLIIDLDRISKKRMVDFWKKELDNAEDLSEYDKRKPRDQLKYYEDELVILENLYSKIKDLKHV